jgi:anti-anti-sigma factor
MLGYGRRVLPPDKQGVAVSEVFVDETGRVDETVLTVRVPGGLGGDAVDELREALVDAIVRRRPARVVVDLRAVTALDSAAVGTLSAAYDAACDMRLILVLRTSSAAVIDQLHRAGIPSGACPPISGGHRLHEAIRGT